MHLFTIGLITSIENFENRLKLEFELLKDEGIDAILKKVNKGGNLYWNCYVLDNKNCHKKSSEEVMEIFLYCIANALSDIIINFFEPKLIKKIIKNDYFYFSNDEQNLLYEYTLDILNFNELEGKYDLLCQIRRKSYVLHKILNYLSENSTIILDGFVRFRLKEYIMQLEVAVDEAVNEYLTNREYQEFIWLLRYFVDLQNPRIDLVHVVFKDNKFYLFDRQINPIENDEFLESIAKENSEINIDDVMISTLINIAPKRIVIHGFKGSEKIEVINALYNIFEAKIVFCNCCDICRDLIPLKIK